MLPTNFLPGVGVPASEGWGVPASGVLGLVLVLLELLLVAGVPPAPGLPPVSGLELVPPAAVLVGVVPPVALVDSPVVPALPLLSPTGSLVTAVCPPLPAGAPASF
jgi:hypothetical protein